MKGNLLDGALTLVCGSSHGAGDVFTNCTDDSIESTDSQWTHTSDTCCIIIQLDFRQPEKTE